MKLKRKTKFWLVVSAILALLLALPVTWTVHKVKDWRWHYAGPIENHPVRIWDVDFAKEFNDLNEVQLAVAQAVGVPPEYLRATLSQVLKDLHDEGACYVKYEKMQTCFHITVRK